MRRFKYFVTEAIRSLIRNRLMSLASIFTVAACIFVVSIFYALAANIDTFLEQLEATIGLVVFVEDDVDAEGVNTLYEHISNIDNILFARFVSPEEAFASAAEQFGDARILDGVAPETFPRSFHVEITDLRYHDAIVAQLEALSELGIYAIRQDQIIVRALITITNMVRWISMGLILILAGSSIVIITNTITITVNARKSEINIMKYIGATDWFIRWPFLIEGILIGIVGSLIPVLATLFGYSGIIDMIGSGLPMLEELRFTPAAQIFTFLFPFAIFLGALIGSMGAGVSVHRHLKV